MKKEHVFFIGVLVVLLIIGGGWYWQNDKVTVATTNVDSGTSVSATSERAECPYTFMSWNIANFGRSRGDDEIAFMATLLARADIVAVQEVTAGKTFGAQAVAKLADALSKTGAEWDYVVSDPTEPPSTGVERYAFLFRKSTVTINRQDAHLVSELSEPVDREPYTLSFKLKDGDAVQIFTIHTVPTAKQPIREVEALVQARELAGQKRAIVAGDFNLGPSKTDAPLERIGFTGHVSELTSLKRKVAGGKYLIHQYDNIYTKGVHVCSSGAVDFVGKHFSPVTDESLARALGISDHLPVFATFR